MKAAILATLASTVAASLTLSTAQAQQTRDCSGFTERASFYSSIGLTDSANFWNAVASECTASNWPAEDRSTVRSNIRTLAENADYERPERSVVQAAAEQAGVELPMRGKGGKKGKGPRGGGDNANQ